ncbi:RNA polymerase sigma factor [Massilia niastensis]|uniref:RNA polymerase sigma factor n=1 Tax=Massilia niastensis TaxID=544911 RepID=UPI00036D21D8|nr:sigma-70 family RNA polymerase sigma factor [Massilia niastensis]
MNGRNHDSELALRDEAWLIGQVAVGDRCAFENLYRLYFPRISRFLYRMTRNVQLIEEITNDAMLAVWQKAATFNGSCKVSTWIFAIAYRKACKALHALDEPLESFPDTWEGEPSCQPERLFEQLRLGDAVNAALDTLPLAQRAAFQLTFFHDMGYAEIADVMDCPVNTVKTRLLHARRRLARLLADQLEERT